MEYAAVSAVGPVRPNNEDHVGICRLAGDQETVIGPASADERGWRVLADGEVHRADLESDGPSGFLFAVADGLGGYGGGEVASALAVESAFAHAAAARPDATPTGLVRAVFETANRRIFDGALAGAGPRQMQTTMTALVLVSGAVTLGHVGDCRVYRLRGGSLEVLTSDHTQIMEMLRLRLVSPEQAADHPARYALTRSVGGDVICRVDVRREPTRSGDVYLVCSDGLWGRQAPAEIAAALRLDPADACRRLLDRAFALDGDDNASAIVIRVAEAGRASDAQPWWRRLAS